MMTYEQVLEMAEALGNDAIVLDFKNQISVDFNDFEGFDENWDEIMRDYDDANAVDAFEEMLENEAIKIDNGFYTTYHFDGFIVKVGYTSYDI